MTPLWAANYQIVYGLFVNGQYAAIRAAGELSRQLARNNDEITDSLREGYEAQQAAYDRVFDGFSDYVRGVDRYVVPDIGRVTLPSSFTICSGGGGSVMLVALGSACPDASVELKPAG